MEARAGRGAASERPHPPAPRPRPDRPGLRPAPRRRSTRPRRQHVRRTPQPAIPPRLWRIPLYLPHDPAHRTRHGPPPPRRPHHHRNLLHRRLLLPRHLQHPLHRTHRRVAEHLPPPSRRRHRRDSLMRGQTGDQTDQESRSAGHRPATSVTTMDITIHASFLPHEDPEASLAFYRDTLGFEVRNDVGYGGMRWITGGPPRPPGTPLIPHPPAPPPPPAAPGITDDERRTIAKMMAKGTYAIITLATKDLDGTFERLQASS